MKKAIEDFNLNQIPKLQAKDDQLDQSIDAEENKNF